jgi:hypothetical protein
MVACQLTAVCNRLALFFYLPPPATHTAHAVDKSNARLFSPMNFSFLSSLIAFSLSRDDPVYLVSIATRPRNRGGGWDAGDFHQPRRRRDVRDGFASR